MKNNWCVFYLFLKNVYLGNRISEKCRDSTSITRIKYYIRGKYSNFTDDGTYMEDFSNIGIICNRMITVLLK